LAWPPTSSISWWSGARRRCFPRERAALAWTEALTLITEGVSDEVYTQARVEFSEQELAYLSSAIASINVWNRLGVAYRWTPPARRTTVSAAAS
jgi:alkylhydroperoxidase family enzyme